MALQYELFKNQMGRKPKGYRATVVNQKIHGKEELIEVILGKGKSLARADVEAVLNCLEESVEHIITSGEGVSTDLFSLRTAINGSFEGPKSGFDQDKNELVLNIRIGKRLKGVLKDIELERVSNSGHGSQITLVKDFLSNSKDNILSPGGPVKIYGKRIKIKAGKVADDREGLYAISLDDGTEQKFATEISNSPAELIYMVPQLKAGQHKLEVRTYYYNGSLLSKNIRVITSLKNFVVK